MNKLFGNLLLTAFMALLSSTGIDASQAQITSLTNATSTPIPAAGHDYIHLVSETVNPANGSVSLRVNMPTPQGRGLSLPFSIGYDSGGVHHLIPGVPVGTAQWKSNTGYLSQGGWSYSVPMANMTEWSVFGQSPRGGQNWVCYYSTAFMFQDSGGSRHQLNVGVGDVLPANESIQCNPSLASVLSGGDPQVSAKLTCNGTPCSFASLTVSDEDGTVYDFPVFGEQLQGSDVTYSLPKSIEDRNGNLINLTQQSSSGAFEFADTLGRAIINSSGFGPSGAVNTVSLSDQSYSIAWKTTTASFSVASKQVASVGSTCSPPPTISDSQVVVSSITLPDTTRQYKFYYGTDNPNPALNNPYGLLSEIVYPDGGSVTYTWMLSPQYSDLADYPGGGASTPTPDGCLYQYQTPVVASRTVTFASGASAALKQTFSYGTTWSTSGNAAGTKWTSKSTTANTTDGGKTAKTSYVYSPVPAYSELFESTSYPGQIPVEQTVQFYDWGAPSTPIKTTTKTWNDQYDLLSEQTSLNNGPASRTAYCYVGSACLPAFNSPAQLKEKDEYDFGGTTPLRKTVITYKNFTNTLGSIMDRPCKIVVSDGSGNSPQETDSYYDGGTTLCGTISGGQVTQAASLPTMVNTHDEPNFGPSATKIPRGNLTRQVRVASPSSTTTYTYDETGQVVSMKDPCGNTTCTDMGGTSHTTTYSYLDKPSGGNAAGNSNAYLTQNTGPNTGVAHVENYQYNYTTGELMQSQDQNNIITKYSYSDPLDRLTLVANAVTSLNAGGQNAESDTSYRYPTTDPEVDVYKDQVATGDGLLQSKTYYDGLGHAIKTVGRDSSVVETAYNGSGRVCAVSNPTTTAPAVLSCVGGQNKAVAATDGFTYFSYDALGRKTLQTQPDNSTQQWLYTGNVVDFHDEDHSHWQRTSDGLGRLITVKENDPAGSGALTLETDYTYGPLDSLLSVKQLGASGDKPRVRYFLYDSLSQLTNACNPEAINTTCSSTGPWSAIYSYDANGNVSSRTDALSIVTNYTYDALNRLTAKSYANDAANNTPSLSYTYDTEYPWQQVTNENNPVGHLNSITATVKTTNLATWTSNDYDQRGTLLGYAECLGADAQSCPGTFSGASYDFYLDESIADLGANAGGATYNGLFEGLTYQYDNSGRMKQLDTTISVDLSGKSLTSTAFSGPTFYPGGAVHTANLAIDPISMIPGITLARTLDNRDIHDR